MASALRPMTPGCRAVAIFLVIVVTVVVSGCGSDPKGGETAPILLFNGAGTSAGDVAAIETVLKSNHLTYSTVDSSALNSTTDLTLRQHRLIVIPGGNFVDM